MKFIAIREQIARLSEDQRMLRNQRRTIRLKGERKVDPYQAANAHRDNRRLLNGLFMAYDLLRGKEITPRGEYHSIYIDKLVEKYKEEVHDS